MVAGGMEQQCVGVVMCLLIHPDARLADGQIGDEVRYLEGEEVQEVPFPLLEVRGGPHGGDRHLHGPVEGVLIKAGCFMGSAADDYRVNGRATAATAVVSTTLGRRGMPAREGWRRATMKRRVAGHCSRRAARVRVATGGDVM
jgi:hypothetical protein